MQFFVALGCSLHAITKWWSVVGVALDIVGFWIIASEWWQAARQGDVLKDQISRIGLWGTDEEEALALKQQEAKRTWTVGDHGYSGWAL